jgi:hypothetical protein
VGGGGGGGGGGVTLSYAARPPPLFKAGFCTLNATVPLNYSKIAVIFVCTERLLAILRIRLDNCYFLFIFAYWANMHKGEKNVKSCPRTISRYCPFQNHLGGRMRDIYILIVSAKESVPQNQGPHVPQGQNK